MARACCAVIVDEEPIQHGNGPRPRLASGWRTVPAYHPRMDRPARHLLTAVVVAVAVGLAGCGITPTILNGDPPVPAGPLGPIVPGQAGAPPVECRGVPLEQCQGFGGIGDPNVVRVIVTCMTVCTAAKGEVRIDVLRPNGTTESMGQGSYAGAVEQPVAAPEPAGSS